MADILKMNLYNWIPGTLKLFEVNETFAAIFYQKFSKRESYLLMFHKLTNFFIREERERINISCENSRK